MMEKLNDLDYFNTSIILLRRLEKVAYARNERLRIFHEKTRAIRAITAVILASILPTVFWITALTSLEVSIFDVQVPGAFMIRLIGLLVTTASLIILPYFFIHMIWRQPLFRAFSYLFEKKVKHQLFSDIEKIDEKANHIISQQVFKKPRVPDHYLSVEYLTLLEKYIASGKAKTVSEAVDYLKSELEHRFYFSSLESHQTLLQKEKDYLTDEKVNLVKRIEKEEEIYG